jgi:predicted deacylase
VKQSDKVKRFLLRNYTSVKVAKDGLDNALRTLGILKGAPKTREEQGLAPAIILDMRAETAYHSVNDFGLYENLFPLGGEIKKGEVLGLVHNMDNPEVPAVPVIARQDGVLGVERGFPRVTPGDVVALVGRAYKSAADLPVL